MKTAVVRWLGENGITNHPTWTLTSLGDEIEEFKRARRGHLFVAGRFDGMDFKADECRLVILATLPKAINIQEEFFTAYLRDAEFMVRRLNQRIVQALGRCNRSADDFGVYLLADRRFATHFGREANRAEIPSNIVAEIDSAEDLTQAPVQHLVERVIAFLSQDFAAYDEDLQQHRDAVPQTRVSEDPSSGSSADEVQGWAELFGSQNYGRAQQHFRRCSDALTAEGLRELGAFLQWCEAKAAFLKGKQGERDSQRLALELLERAIERGGRSSWFNRLRSSLNRYVARSERTQRRLPAGLEYTDALLQVFDERLERLGTEGPSFQRWADSVTAKLESDRHAPYVEGLEELGRLLGYSASRPTYGASTDCRWRGAFGDVREVVTFEAKIEHSSSARITPHHVGQAHNQLTRAREQFGARGFTVRGTIVTHLASIDLSAQASLGDIRVVAKGALLELWHRVRTLLSQYRDHWSLHDLTARSSAADRVAARLPPVGWLTRALSGGGPFASEADLMSEWPRP